MGVSVQHHSTRAIPRAIYANSQLPQTKRNENETKHPKRSIPRVWLPSWERGDRNLDVQITAFAKKKVRVEVLKRTTTT